MAKRKHDAISTPNPELALWREQLHQVLCALENAAESNSDKAAAEILGALHCALHWGEPSVEMLAESSREFTVRAGIAYMDANPDVRREFEARTKGLRKLRPNRQPHQTSDPEHN